VGLILAEQTLLIALDDPRWSRKMGRATWLSVQARRRIGADPQRHA
jgi:hypothetical protein